MEWHVASRASCVVSTDDCEQPDHASAVPPRGLSRSCGDLRSTGTGSFPVPPIEACRWSGSYALPIAAPDLVGDRPRVAGGSWVPDLWDGPWNAAASSQATTPGPHGRWAFRLAQFSLLVTFMAAEALKGITSQVALRGKGPDVTQSMVLMQGVVSLICAVFLSAALEGLPGLKAAFSPRCVLQCIPVSIGFALSASAVSLAMGQGLDAATVMVIGVIYMPLCAWLSHFIFARKYGWLEIHALAFLTLSAMMFVELRSRADSLPRNSTAIGWNLVAVVLACLSSLYGERNLKAKYSPGDLAQPFHVQKVWFEAGGLAVVAIVGLTIWIFRWNGDCCFHWQHRSGPGMDGLVPEIAERRLSNRSLGDWIQEVSKSWDAMMVSALAMRVLQAWMAGLLAKRLSTVAKAVVQSCSMLIVWFSIEAMNGGEFDLQSSVVSIIVALSTLMYQMGRRNTEKRLQASTQVQAGGREGPAACRANGAEVARNSSTVPEASEETEPRLPHSMSDPTGLLLRYQSEHVQTLRDNTTTLTGSMLRPDDHALAPSEFRDAPGVGARGALPRGFLLAFSRSDFMRIIDRSWLEQAREINTKLSSWISSTAGLSSQLVFVMLFIASDASRTLIFAWAINGAPIVQQSIVVTVSAASVLVGVLMSTVFDGRDGFTAAACDIWSTLRCLPVAACFSVGQTLQIKAYGFGINPAVNTVLGYFYMPLSALLSRWVFRRAYGVLEWLALVLLSASSVLFVLLRQDRSDGGTSLVAAACCLGAVATSCIGSLSSERIMKAQQSPFYTQKVHLEYGGLLTATLGLFLIGVASSQDADAFWKPRDVGGGKMRSGLFVGWSAPTFAAVAATLVQSWLGGLVSKRLSTVVRSVAQCLSLLIVYFFGDLVLRALQFDWVMGGAAVVVALSVQVFALAGLRERSNNESAGDRS